MQLGNRVDLESKSSIEDRHSSASKPPIRTLKKNRSSILENNLWFHLVWTDWKKKRRRNEDLFDWRGSSECNDSTTMNCFRLENYSRWRCVSTKNKERHLKRGINRSVFGNWNTKIWNDTTKKRIRSNSSFSGLSVTRWRFIDEMRLPHEEEHNPLLVEVDFDCLPTEPSVDTFDYVKWSKKNDQRRFRWSKNVGVSPRRFIHCTINQSIRQF